jgi:hypothetical protein
MFGRTAKCPCGATLHIPDPRASTEQADAFWDDLQEDVPVSDAEAVASPTRTPEEEGQDRYASLYSAAIVQIQSGTSPKHVRDNLIDRGVPQDVASDMVRQIAPQGYVERADNRAAGRAQMIQGVIAFAAGSLLGLVLSQFGLIALLSLILIVVGLFRFATGLISFITGSR